MHMITNILLTLILIVEGLKLAINVNLTENIEQFKSDLNNIKYDTKAIRSHTFSTVLSIVKHGI